MSQWTLEKEKLKVYFKLKQVRMEATGSKIETGKIKLILCLTVLSYKERSLKINYLSKRRSRKEFSIWL